MFNKLQLTGQKFGRWTVLGYAFYSKKHYFWKCRCECGTEKNVRSFALISGHSKSCGCLAKELLSERKLGKKNHFFKHGLRYSPIYSRWQNMKKRCFSSNHRLYHRYSGRGITVCDRWLKIENFYDDMYRSFKKHCEKYGEKNTTLDRIDNNGNYEPLNCRWSTWKENENNRNNNKFYTYNGKTMNIRDWAKELNIPLSTLSNKIYIKKLSFKESINQLNN